MILSYLFPSNAANQICSQFFSNDWILGKNEKLVELWLQNIEDKRVLVDSVSSDEISWFAYQQVLKFIDQMRLSNKLVLDAEQLQSK